MTIPADLAAGAYHLPGPITGVEVRVYVAPTAADRFAGRSVATEATRHAPYWQARTSGRVHRVGALRILWKAANATWARPRITLDLKCRRPYGNLTAGLRNTIPDDDRAHLCPKCFPIAADPEIAGLDPGPCSSSRSPMDARQ